MTHHTSRRRHRRTYAAASATLTAAALVCLSAAPGLASTPLVAQASGVGLTLTVANTDTDSGTYRVTNDGTTQESSGNNKPPIDLLTGQSFIQAGTLAQDATTRIVNRNGQSFACAGLAGDGSALAAAGDGGCLTPGKNLTLNAANLDLSNLQIVSSTILNGLDTQLQTALQPVLNALLPALQGSLQTALTTLGNPGVFLDLGAVQTSCKATPTTASATADLADVKAYAEVAGQRVDLLSFPTHPAPNTKVVTNLDKVAVLIEQALKKQLTTGLNGALGALGGTIDQTTVLNNLLANLSSQLAPLEANVLDATLNLQPKHAANEITATALDLNVLPAAKAFSVTALHAAIGTSSCGPNARVAEPKPTPSPSPSPKPSPTPTHHPTGVPTAVDAGLASGGGAGDDAPMSAAGAAALGGILLLSAGAGTAAYRRSLRR